MLTLHEHCGRLWTEGRSFGVAGFGPEAVVSVWPALDRVRRPEFRCGRIWAVGRSFGVAGFGPEVVVSVVQQQLPS
jgi:hypothetical protein